MGLYFDPVVYLVTLAAPLLLGGLVGALLVRRWARIARYAVVGLAALAVIEYWMLVSPRTMGVEAWPHHWRACSTLGVALLVGGGVIVRATASRRSRSRLRG